VRARILSHAGYRRTRWANNGGWTHEIVRCPATGPSFDWRLSQADIDEDGPFSQFPGCQRELIVLTGGVRLTLAAPHEDVELTSPLDHFRFDGDRVVHAEVVSRPARDLNVIWRPDRVTVKVHTIEIVENQVPIDLPLQAVVSLYVAGGSFEAVLPGSNETLGCDDTLLIDDITADERLMAHGRAQLIAIAISVT
jgi:uncharacterized protein